jgi:hypothetical protein
MRARSAIGFFLFTHAGHNEKLLAESGFTVLEVQDVTAAVATVASRWRQARADRSERLIPLEGEAAFQDLQRFLETVHTLASQGRLSRFMYLAQKPPSAGRG